MFELKVLGSTFLDVALREARIWHGKEWYGKLVTRILLGKQGKKKKDKREREGEEDGCNGNWGDGGGKVVVRGLPMGIVGPS